MTLWNPSELLPNQKYTIISINNNPVTLYAKTNEKGILSATDEKPNYSIEEQKNTPKSKPESEVKEKSNDILLSSIATSVVIEDNNKDKEKDKRKKSCSLM